ncbi:MAG: BNR domain-containing protein, partial [Polyangia bacterium]
EDLYAVAFADDHKGLVVGAHGAALLTRDGGASWTDVSTGLDGYLGAATWLDADTALVVGEAGTALTFAAP